jgi:hypothetical protein
MTPYRDIDIRYFDSLGEPEEELAEDEREWTYEDGPLTEADRLRLALEDAETESLETLEAGSDILATLDRDTP